ncbi:MAG: 4Fe-4S binding protein [Desulfovibrio sp.]|nr:4Fe-4S binding protein [Desulfovibrio sp.]
MKKKNWYEWLWIWPVVYFSLGFFNILFAWLGMIDFLLPLFIAIFFGNKWFCNNICGRAQLFVFLPRVFKCSRQKAAPRWMSSALFRYGFLAFFLAMFGSIIHQSIMVFNGSSSLRQAVTLLWTFQIPWRWAYVQGSGTDWSAQFSYGFYSLMLTSAIIGLIVMVLYRPRAWCSFCPMGSMTQLICKAKQKGKNPPED